MLLLLLIWWWCHLRISLRFHLLLSIILVYCIVAIIMSMLHGLVISSCCLILISIILLNMPRWFFFSEDRFFLDRVSILRPLHLLCNYHVRILLILKCQLRGIVPISSNIWVVSQAETWSLVNFERIWIYILHGAVLRWAAAVWHLQRLVEVFLMLQVYYSI